MANWQHTTTFKHLLTDSVNPVDIRDEMRGVQRIIGSDRWWARFDMRQFRDFHSVRDAFVEDVANGILARMYDYADDNRIWCD